MEANPMFTGKTNEFWAHVKFITEKLGYSRNNQVISHSKEKIINKFNELHINYIEDTLDEAIEYTEYRKDVLNNIVKNSLMNVEEASHLFQKYYKVSKENGYTVSLPLNKQKGIKKDYAFFTCIINIITEQTLRKLKVSHNNDNPSEVILDLFGKEDTDMPPPLFNDDPKNFVYILDKDNYLDGILTRRFDGAFPSLVNPKAIWEIKEYYYTTTFGSRIADGVYETQLDGFEINSLSEKVFGDIKHIYFIDSKQTWWDKGKSYLCRIIDMLHIGLVDEVIFGKEVETRWPIVLEKIVNLPDVESF